MIKFEKKYLKKIIFMALFINVLLQGSEIEDLIKNYYDNNNYNLYDRNSTTKSTIKTKIIEKPILNISKRELMIVADKIYKNETGGKRDALVSWNAGENFPSLGIGHFIWFKAGQRGVFGESLPGLVNYYKENGVKLPKVLEQNRYSPWSSRTELLNKKQKNDKDVSELIDFFEGTKEVQVMYIFKRLEESLGKMLEVSTKKDNLKYQFYRVANSPNGLYALIDYVNFKGEGISTSPSYNYQGWGLRQVLENMTGSGVGREALLEFSESAKYILEKRVNNAPRNEKQWLPGWKNRVETYKNFEIR